MALTKKEQETIKRLEAELVEAEGLTALDRLLDEFVRDNLALIYERLKLGIRFPYKVSPLLIKLIDKAKPSPIAMKIKGEGFKLEVVHRMAQPDVDEGPKQLEEVVVVRSSDRLPMPGGETESGERGGRASRLEPLREEREGSEDGVGEEGEKQNLRSYARGGVVESHGEEVDVSPVTYSRAST